MTAIRTDGLVWIAARDGVAHGRSDTRRSTRNLCGSVAVADRYAWPIVTRCARCVEAAACRPGGLG